MIELERTFLLRFIPPGLEKCPSKEILDIYLPHSAPHPNLRIRKSGDKYEMTKKEPVDKSDMTRLSETTITLTRAEFDDLSHVQGKRVHKIRYYYLFDARTAEIDIFQESLSGLCLVDFEFNSESEKNAFKMPDFCLVDITPHEFISGGMLCGESYQDIEKNLDRFHYKKMSFHQNL